MLLLHTSIERLTVVVVVRRNVFFSSCLPYSFGSRAMAVVGKGAGIFSLYGTSWETNRRQTEWMGGKCLSRGRQKENFKPRSSCRPSYKSWWDERIEEIAAMFILGSFSRIHNTRMVQDVRKVCYGRQEGEKIILA